MANDVVEFITRSMKNWNVDLMSYGEFEAKVNILQEMDFAMIQYFASSICALYDPTYKTVKKSLNGIHSEVWPKVKSFAIL